MSPVSMGSRVHSWMRSTAIAAAMVAATWAGMVQAGRVDDGSMHAIVRGVRHAPGPDAPGPVRTHEFASACWLPFGVAGLGSPDLDSMGNDDGSDDDCPYPRPRHHHVRHRRHGGQPG